MQQERKRGLTKIALALALAGYCSVPAALAADESGGNLKAQTGWTSDSRTTGTIQGTVPWLNRSADVLVDVPADTAHVTVTVDRHGRAGDASSAAYRQLHVGDTVTVTWGIGDTQGDIDGEGGTKNNATKATIKWTSFTDDSGAGGVELATGDNSYTIKKADISKYIGLKITPTTTTGDPATGIELTLNDISSNDGGGDDTDDLPSGPVVDDNLHVVIHEEGSNTNLLTTATKLKTNTTYQVLLWSDKDGDGTYDAGEDVTNDYHYRWRFTGTSLQLGTAGGIANPSTNDADLVIPVTNAQAKTAFDYASGITIGNDGIQGYGLSIDYQHK